MSFGISPFSLLLPRYNLFKDVNVEKSGSVPLILFTSRFNSSNEYLAQLDKCEIIVGSSTLKLLSLICNEFKAHAFPNDFGIPPSMKFPLINKSSKVDGNFTLSGILPLNRFP
ncbi:hypothetical protein V8G54_011039 [Vigna mungo]|uniref:Uncharacterized protein n=1 Tax=Vigna mungo TaxID=3915 RepID=A0AAQ3S1X7_VIGMU